MTELDNSKTDAASQPTTSPNPEKLSERRADPELLESHGIACPKATLEALRNWGAQRRISQD